MVRVMVWFYQPKPLLISSDKPSKSYHTNFIIRKGKDPNDILSIDNPNSPWCGFNYLDINTYVQHLQADFLTSLQCEMQLIATDLYDNCKESKIIGTTRNSKSISKNITSDLDRYFITVAIEAVQVKHNLPLSIVEE